MADFFIDTSTIGNEYGAYADTPTTWAQPQDGNGKAASAASSAVPVAEVTFAAIPTTGAISVYGVTITLTGVLSAASTAAAATALASSINASTTATGATVSQQLLPINRFVYARVKPGGGANDSIVQIMSRLAGADLNYASGANASARITNTFNNTAMTSPVDFAGGTDGPWGYFCNSATVFGKVFGTYGMLPAKSPTPAEPGAADTIWVRTRRSGSSLTVTFTTASNTNIALQSQNARHFLSDHGTKWAGDDGVFTFDVISVGTSFVSIRGPDSTEFSFYGGKQGGFHFKHTATSTSASLALGGIAGNNKWFNATSCDFTAVNSTSTIALAYFQSNCTGARRNFDFCRFYFKRQQTLVFNDFSSSGNWFSARSCAFYWTGIGGNVSGFLSPGDSGSAFIRISNSLFNVDAGAWAAQNPVLSGSSNTGGDISIHLENCAGLAASSFGFATLAAPSLGRRFAWDDTEGTGGYRVETPYYATEWINNGTYPTLTAVSRAGDPMGARIFWRTAGVLESASVQAAKLSTKYQAADAALTLILELLTPAAEVPTYADLQIHFRYTNAAGEAKLLRLAEPPALKRAGAATSIPTSAASWTLNGVAGYEARKFSVATPDSVKSGTAVTAELWIAVSPSADRYIYFNPEIGFA